MLLAWSPLYVPHVGAGLPSRLSLRRTHPRGGGIGRHFSLTMCGASLRHETTAVGTLLTPYRTAVEYRGVSSPGWAGLCRETRPGDRIRHDGHDGRQKVESWDGLVLMLVYSACRPGPGGAWCNCLGMAAHPHAPHTSTNGTAHDESGRAGTSPACCHLALLPEPT